MDIHLIWAQDSNGGIGKQGALPWHISEDLKNFKKLTLNSTIVMGRKTWDSLPFKPLPKRRNIVLSHSTLPDIEAYHSIEQCIDRLEDEKIEKLFVIGGAAIYKEFFNHAHYLHITMVNLEQDNIDTFFPISLNVIKQKFNQTLHQKLSDDADYTFWFRK